jgi:DNA repair protein RecO (recombination protein O)
LQAAPVKRIAHEPAFVLHGYDWSESSRILEVFTRHHGRVALVAKGVKKPSSNFRPILLPLQPLHISYSGDAEVHTLKAAEWIGGYVMPTGAALLSGYYINELLMRLLARDDSHPALFDAYASTVELLATQAQSSAQLALRVFELLLLREIGLLPALNVQTANLQDLQSDAAYTLVPEGGLRLAHADDRAHLPGAQWLALQAALDDATPFIALLKVCTALPSDLKPLLRHLLNYHCGGQGLKTRQLMVELQNL